VVGVTDDADGRPALGTDAAHLARRQGDLCPALAAGAHRHRGAGAAAELAAATRLQFDVVNFHAAGDAAQWQTVADARLGVVAAENAIAGLEALGREDVTLLAVLVLHQGDARRAIGVVLDADHGRPDVVLAP